jgi:hypothetical protein
MEAALKSYQNRLLHFVLIIVLVVITAVIVTPAQAAAVISVSGVWHPGLQLTTVDTGLPHQTDALNDDLRYVDAEVYVTTNTQFWSVQLTCTVSPTVLESYAAHGDPGGTGDDIDMLTWGPQWGPELDAFWGVPGNHNPTFTATGAETVAASRAGLNTPMGANGITQTILLATFHYRVKSVAGMSPFTCVSTFLDRNGVSVGAATYVAPTPLSVIAGYTISGTLAYQGRATKLGIGVTCTGPDPINGVATDATGKFLKTTRKQGQYNCKYYGRITNAGLTPHDDVYLQGKTSINLNTQSYTLLPTTLNGGNVMETADDTAIDPGDIGLITANYNLTVPANTIGDINGDGKVNQADLSIATANMGLSDSTSLAHVLFGLARSNFGTPGPDNRIWLGTDYSGAVTPVGTSTSRDFWPTLSPNGSKIAFAREVKVGNSLTYSLFTMNPDGSAVTQLTKSTATLDYSVAPAWSPDGTRIAYDCGFVDDGGLSFGFNRTNICVIDATGRNQQAIAFEATIYPPTWASNTLLLYGGKCGTVPVDALTICKIDLSTLGGGSEFSTNIDTTGGRTNDLPMVFDNKLFYRTNLAADHRLRYAELTGTPPVVSPSVPPTTTTPFHVDVTSDGTTAISTDVDYYAISTDGLQNLMFYVGGDHSCFGNNFIYEYYQPGIPPGTPPTWTDFVGSTTHEVYDAFCNPYWDNNPSNPTNLWAQRNSIHWVP